MSFSVHRDDGGQHLVHLLHGRPLFRFVVDAANGELPERSRAVFGYLGAQAVEVQRVRIELLLPQTIQVDFAPCNDFAEQNAKRKHISLFVVRFAQQQFRGVEVGATTHGHARFFTRLDGTCKSKVTQLNVPLAIHQEVFALDITMDNVAGVHEGQRTGHVLGKAYNEKADVFAFGILLCEVITRGKVNLDRLGKKEFNAYALDLDGLRAKVPKDCPGPFWKLAVCCVNYEPEKRPSMKQVDKMLSAIISMYSK